jgi:hypothetical protein
MSAVGSVLLSLQLADAGVEARGVEEYPWGRFVFFTDPDGNGWAVEELPPGE